MYELILTFLIYFTRHNQYNPKTDNKGNEGIIFNNLFFIFYKFSNKIRPVNRLVIRITDIKLFKEIYISKIILNIKITTT